MADDKVLPTDPWEKNLASLLGRPGGAHTDPALIQAADFYGNVTSFMVQTVKWEDGTTVFVTLVNSESGETKAKRFMLPPKLMAAIARQQEAVVTMVRRRHGKRLAEARRASGQQVGGFTDEMREKAAATRRAKADRRRKRKTGKVKGG